MDCDRAISAIPCGGETYDEVQENEPSADVIAEARIVMASSLAISSATSRRSTLLVRAGGTKILRNPA